MRRKPIMLAVLLIVVLVGGAGFALMRGSASKNSAAPASPPVPIVAGTVDQHDVPIYLTGVGTVVAFNTVVVRSQIRDSSSASTSPKARPSMPATCWRRSIRVPIRPRSTS